MRAIGLVAIILLLVFILPVCADDAADTITFTTSEEWLVANGADSCQATVQVNNGLDPVPGLEVEFSSDTEYGTFDPAKNHNRCIWELRCPRSR